jgi:RNA polymerase sigma-70 factor (ECF subfamily)
VSDARVVALTPPADGGNGRGRVAGHVRSADHAPANGNGAASLTEERALVVAAKDDPGAFEALYLIYVERIYAFLYRRCGCPDVAEDMTAATFESALRSLDRLDPDRVTFGPWLFRVASNRLVDHYRRERRADGPRGQRALSLLTTSDSEAAPGDATETAALRDAMLAALQTLRPRYRQALELRYLSGLSIDDAAEAMDCSRAVLSVTVHRALGALRHAMTNGDEP